MKRLQNGHPAGRAPGPAGQQHLRHALQLPRRDPARRRRLRLRRGDGADRLDRRQARHAAPASALSRAESGLWGCPTLINNVETFANIAPIVRNGARVVRRDRHREEQGHQGLRAGRPGRQHRPDRSADGHHAARDHLRDRRRHSRRQAVQGRADRRTLGRLHPRASTSIRRWITNRSRASARSWARAA